MAKIYANGSNAVTRLVQTAEEEQRFGAPAGTAHTLDFDTRTNLALVDDIIEFMHLYTYDGADLKKSGVTQTIEPPGALEIEDNYGIKFRVPIELALPDGTVFGKAYAEDLGGGVKKLHIEVIEPGVSLRLYSPEKVIIDAPQGGVEVFPADGVKIQSSGEDVPSLEVVGQFNNASWFRVKDVDDDIWFEVLPDGTVEYEGVEVAKINDSRFTDARTPTAHSHAIADLPSEVARRIYSQQTTKTVTSASKTVLHDTASGVGSAISSSNISLSGMGPGTEFHIKLGGSISIANTAHTANFLVEFGSTPIAVTNDLFFDNTISNVDFSIDLLLTCRGSGASGKVYASGRLWILGTYGMVTGGGDFIGTGFFLDEDGSGTIDFGNAHNLNISVDFSSVTGGTQVLVHTYSVHRVG